MERLNACLREGLEETRRLETEVERLKEQWRVAWERRIRGLEAHQQLLKDVQFILWHDGRMAETEAIGEPPETPKKGA